MALLFLGTGIGLAVWGMYSKLGKNILTAVSVAVVLSFLLLMAGAPVPGEVILIALPAWVLTFMKAKSKPKKGVKAGKNED